jgi:hypothetical protein
MKKMAYLGVIFIMLAVLVVPAMAKTPPHGNGNGNNKTPESSTGVNPADQGQGNQSDQHNQQNQGNHGRGNGSATTVRSRTPFYLQGTIKSIDTGTKILVVTLFHGNAQVKQYLYGDLSIQATDGTLIFKLTQGDEGETEGETVGGESSTPTLSSSESTTSDEGDSNRVAIPFDQLEVGKKVAIHGNLVDGVFTARLITEYIQTPVGESTGEQP